MTIYTITTFEKYEIDHNTNGNIEVKTGDVRTIGFYSDLNIAMSDVEHNSCDMYEGCYEYVLIEGFQEGLYCFPSVLPRFLYKFNKQTKHYEQIDMPAVLEVIPFAMG